MLLEKERKQVVEYGKKLIEEGLTEGTGGNISVSNPEKKLMAISPSGMDYFETEPEDIVVLNMEGEVVEGDRKPSSEVDMHKIFHAKREDVTAVVHTHSTFATVLAMLNWAIPPAHYLIAVAGKKVPCAEYKTFGTQELAESAYRAMGEKYDATLLANHGLLAVGNNIEAAFNKANTIEFVAELYYKSKCAGEPVVLPDDEMDLMLEKFKTYGQ